MSFLPQGASGLNSFTCNTCNIRFAAADLQRQHMKTDWHRYNLKRRVAQLPGISSEVFAEKVLAAQEHEEPEEDEFGFAIRRKRRERKEKAGETVGEKVGERVGSQGRSQVEGATHPRLGRLQEISGSGERDASVASEKSDFSDFSEFSLGESEPESHWTYDSMDSENGYTSSDFVSHESSDSEGSVSEEEMSATALPVHWCFYCGKNNHELEQNIRHMSRAHGLYIPERTYLTDVEGLLMFLSEVVTEDFECLVCGFEGRSLESIRQHLESKGHCRIPYETAAEKAVVAEFYEFDVRREPDRLRTTRKVKFSEETDKNDMDNELEQDPNNHNESEKEKELPNSGESREVDSDPESESASVAYLPNGAMVAHRSARRRSQSVQLPESTKTVAVADRRFAPGLTSRTVTKQEKQMQRLQVKAENLHHRRTKTRRANFQQHFRDELLGTVN